MRYRWVKAQGKVHLWLPSLSSALYQVERLTSRPRRLISRKERRYTLGGPHSRSGRSPEQYNILPLPRFEHRTVQSLAQSPHRQRYCGSRYTRCREKMSWSVVTAVVMKERGEPREMARTTAKRVKKWNVLPAEQSYRTGARTFQKRRSMDGEQNVRSTSEVRKRFYFGQITLISGSDYRPTSILKGNISTVRYCITGGTK